MSPKPARHRLITAALTVCLSGGLLFGQSAPPTYTANQKVRVREGDVWSAGTVVTQEGRRVKVKYDDGTDEWVPLARLRAAGAADTTAPATDAPADADADAKPKAAPAERVPATGKCEVKDGRRWKPAIIHNRDGDLYLIEFDGWKHQMHWKWVSVDCVRAVGSTKEGPANGQGEGVGGKTLQEAKANAKLKLAGWRAAAKADANAGANAGADGGAGGAKERSPFDPVPYDKPVTRVTDDGVRELLPDPPAGAWAFTPEPAAPVKTTARSVAFRGERPFGAGVSLLAVGDAAVIAYASSGEGGFVRIEKINLFAGTAAPKDFDPLSLPIAISGDGKRLLGRANGFFGGTKNRVDLWSLEASDPKHLVSFEPFADDSDKGNRDVAFAALLDGGTVLTANNRGTLVAFDPGDPAAKDKAVKALWRMSFGQGVEFALSPSRKTLAAVGPDGLVLIDPATGATRQQIAGPRRADSVTFTADGRRVVTVSGSLLSSYDLSTGTVGPDIGLPPMVNARRVTGVSADCVLLGGQWLFDLKKQAVVWEYAGGGDPIAVAAGRTWALVTDNGRNALASAALPDPAATRAISDWAGGPLLRPGDSLSLEVAIEGDDKQRASVTAAIKKQLADGGLRVADGQPIRLVARTENGKTTQETWQRMGGPRFGNDKENVDITEKITRIYFEDHGKVVWENRTVARPFGTLRAQADKSIGQAVHDANQFDLGFLQSVRIPTVVPRFRDPLTPGKSMWTIGGVSETKAK